MALMLRWYFRTGKPNITKLGRQSALTAGGLWVANRPLAHSALILEESMHLLDLSIVKNEMKSWLAGNKR